VRRRALHPRHRLASPRRSRGPLHRTRLRLARPQDRHRPQDPQPPEPAPRPPPRQRHHHHRRLNPKPPRPGPLPIAPRTVKPCPLVVGDSHGQSASTCRELPFCPVARIRAALRIPDGAGAYRGIRANMEQTSMRIGLDQCVKASGARPRGVRRAIGERYSSRRDGTWRLRWRAWPQLSARLVIPAGSIRAEGVRP
jgi:hypothetical protein